MCYAKPGPRCSSHAKIALISARKRYIKSKRENDPIARIEQLKLEVEKSEKDFFMTPDGIKLLRAKIINEKNISQKEKIIALLHDAQSNYNLQLKAYRVSTMKDKLSDREKETFLRTGLARTNETAVSCKKCLSPLSEDEVKELRYKSINCSVCDKSIFNYDEAYITVNHEDKSLFSKDTVYSQTWYHATQRENWYEDISNTGNIDINSTRLVHLGSSQAAQDRKDDIDRVNKRKNKRSGTWFIYEVKIKNNSVISDYIVADDDADFPDTIKQAKANPKKYGDNTTRYINKFEAPGSISLLTRPENFEVVRKVQI